MVQVGADEAPQQPPQTYAEDFPEAVVDGVAQVHRQTPGPRLDPRLRGCRGFHRRRDPGLGVVVVAIDTCRASRR